MDRSNLPPRTVDYAEARMLSELLARKIIMDYKPDLLLGIMNGGGVVAALLSQFLRKHLGHKRVACIPVSYYQERTVREDYDEPTADLPWYPVVESQKVLLVDDINDTGRTLKMQAECCKIRGAAEVKTAVLHYRSDSSRFRPDYFAEEVAPSVGYIGYPWEVDALSL